MHIDTHTRPVTLTWARPGCRWVEGYAAWSPSCNRSLPPLWLLSSAGVWAAAGEAPSAGWMAHSEWSPSHWTARCCRHPWRKKGNIWTSGNMMEKWATKQLYHPATYYSSKWCLYVMQCVLIDLQSVFVIPYPIIYKLYNPYITVDHFL